MAGQPLELNWELTLLYKSEGLLDDPDYKFLRKNLPDA